MSHMRRASSLRNVVAKRSSINAPVNLNCLVRVYLLDGSSKVLQMFSNSTARDVLVALKYNLDLHDISTFGLFRVVGNNVRRVELNEVVSEVMKDPTNSGQEVRLLFRSWITFKYGAYDHEVFQHTVRNKQANTALWLAFMEAVFMCMTGKFYLSEDEAIMLGCLKMQAESGDFNPLHHDIQVMKQRVSSRFPEPVKGKMKALLTQANTNPVAAITADDIATRVQSLYARIAGKSKVEAQINYLETLRTWCPLYGSTLYEVQCQYDDNPLDPESSPPVITMNAWVGPQAIFLLTPTNPPVIMRHPYRRIIKWVTLPDKHIFTYWVIKPNVTLADLDKFQERKKRELRRQKKHHGDNNLNHSDEEEEEDNDKNSNDEKDDLDASQATGLIGEDEAQQFCDCVYLVTSQVKELDYLVKSYVECMAGHAPVLPGATDDLLPIKVMLGNYHHQEDTRNSESTAENPDEKEQGGDTKNHAKTATPSAETATKPRVGRLSLFFSSLGGGGGGGSSNTGSGLGLGASQGVSGHGHDSEDDDDNDDSDSNHSSEIEDDMEHRAKLGDEEEQFGDDTAAVTNSWFRNMYKMDKQVKPHGKNRTNSRNNSTGKEKTNGKKRGSILVEDAKPDEMCVQSIPLEVKYAASMSELKRMAEESHFSDDEGGGDDDDEEEDASSEEGGQKSTKKSHRQNSDDDGDEDECSEDDDNDGSGRKKKMSGLSSATAFRRASRILFG